MNTRPFPKHAPGTRWILLSALLVSAGICVPRSVVGQLGFDPRRIDERDHLLWDSTLAYSVRATPWTNAPTESSQALMIPMHAAFFLHDLTMQRQFTEMFKRLPSGDHAWEGMSTLERLEFTHFIGRFVALAYQTGRASAVPPGLIDRLRRDFVWWWTEAPVLRSGLPPVRGERTRIRWLLSPGTLKPSYVKLWYDQDWFIQGLAADLRIVERLSNAPRDPAIADALALTERCFRQFAIAGRDGGLTIQPGVWRDYPDYAYSSYRTMSQGLTPAPSSSGSWDSSHSIRLAVFLASLGEAYAPGAARRHFYLDTLRPRLIRQLRRHVLVPPDSSFPAWRATNYMDGSNGLYRWHRDADGTFRGRGPYELSGALTLGWWGLLGDPWIASMYKDERRAFPLPPEVAAVYDASGIQERGSSPFSDSNSSLSRERELLVRLAEKIARTPTLVMGGR